MEASRRQAEVPGWLSVACMHAGLGFSLYSKRYSQAGLGLSLGRRLHRRLEPRCEWYFFTWRLFTRRPPTSLHLGRTKERRVPSESRPESHALPAQGASLSYPGGVRRCHRGAAGLVYRGWADSYASPQSELLRTTWQTTRVFGTDSRVKIQGKGFEWTGVLRVRQNSETQTFSNVSHPFLEFFSNLNPRRSGHCAVL
jgi:hypothetical protein